MRLGLPVRRILMCHQRNIGGLDARRTRHGFPELIVDPVKDRRQASEVLDKFDTHATAFRRELLVHLVVDRDIGAAEAVDRLLGVTDDEEPSRHNLECPPIGHIGLFGVGTQEPCNLSLERIGVLELVDKQPLPSSVGTTAHFRVVTKQVTRPRQQILKRRHTGSPAPVCFTPGKGIHVEEDPAQRIVPDLSDRHSREFINC